MILFFSYLYMIFPKEINETILSFVDPHALNNYEMTCKRNYTGHQRIWGMFLHNDLNELKCKLNPSSKLYNNKNYKKVYRKLIVPIKKMYIYCKPSEGLMNCIRFNDFPNNNWDWFKIIYKHPFYHRETDIAKYLRDLRRRILCQDDSIYIGRKKSIYPGEYLDQYNQINYMNDGVRNCCKTESDFRYYVRSLVRINLIQN
jgi:hypothetical protein